MISGNFLCLFIVNLSFLHADFLKVKGSYILSGDGIKGFKVPEFLALANEKSDITKRGLGYSQPEKRWPFNTIKIYFEKGHFDRTQKNVLRKAAREWMQNTCLKILFFDTPPRDHHVTVVKTTEGCNADAAYLPGKKQYLKLRKDCMQHRSMLFLLGLIIGLLPETKRTDRDRYIEIKGKFKDPKRAKELDKVSGGIADTYGVPYDYYSIMHYPKEGKDADGSIIRFIAKNSAFMNIIGSQSSVSFRDLLTVNRMYKCREDKCKRKCPGEQFLDASCRCVCKGNTGIGTPTKLCPGECPDNFVQVEDVRGACYRLALKQQHREGFDFCRRIKGSIARIESERELKMLKRWLYRQHQPTFARVAGFKLVDRIVNDQFLPYNNFNNIYRRVQYGGHCLHITQNEFDTYDGIFANCNNYEYTICKYK